jgi:hypothetical protein
MTTGPIFWTVFWAAIGGAFVFVGLLMEQAAEKSWFKNIGQFHLMKWIKCSGEWFVIIGVGIEVFIAVLTAIDERKTWQKANEADLHNQAIFALSGYAMVLMMPDDTNEFDKALATIEEPPSLFKFRSPASGNSDVNGISLMFGSATEIATSTGDGTAFFFPPDNVSETISTYGGERLLRFDIYFGENQDSFQNRFLTPSKLDAVNISLPMGGEIVNGKVEISIDHDFIKRVFNVPRQTSFGTSVSCIESNGAFAPIDWSPPIRDGLAKSEAVRKQKAAEQADFIAKGEALEAKANGDKTKGRTITSEQSELFRTLLRDFPKMPIKVFVNTNDSEAFAYANKIRQLLDATDYGGSGGGTFELPGEIRVGTNVAKWQPSPRTLVYVAVPDPKYGLVVPISTPFNSIKPVISSGLTNDPAMYAAGKLYCVKWAFSGIGLGGLFISDTNLLRPGEAAIIVPQKAN